MRTGGSAQRHTFAQKIDLGVASLRMIGWDALFDLQESEKAAVLSLHVAIACSIFLVWVLMKSDVAPRLKAFNGDESQCSLALCHGFNHYCCFVKVFNLVQCYFFLLASDPA